MGQGWRVSSQYFDGRKMYIAMRRLDPAQPQHGGNVETRGIYTEEKDMVQRLVNRLNESKEEDQE